MSWRIFFQLYSYGKLRRYNSDNNTHCIGCVAGELSVHLMNGQTLSFVCDAPGISIGDLRRWLAANAGKSKYHGEGVGAFNPRLKI